jgi:signal transduction histidine kinase
MKLFVLLLFILICLNTNGQDNIVLSKSYEIHLLTLPLIDINNSLTPDSAFTLITKGNPYQNREHVRDESHKLVNTSWYLVKLINKGTSTDYSLNIFLPKVNSLALYESNKADSTKFKEILSSTRGIRDITEKMQEDIIVSDSMIAPPYYFIHNNGLTESTLIYRYLIRPPDQESYLLIKAKYPGPIARATLEISAINKPESLSSFNNLRYSIITGFTILILAFMVMYVKTRDIVYLLIVCLIFLSVVQLLMFQNSQTRDLRSLHDLISFSIIPPLLINLKKENSTLIKYWYGLIAVQMCLYLFNYFQVFSIKQESIYYKGTGILLCIMYLIFICLTIFKSLHANNKPKSYYYFCFLLLVIYLTPILFLFEAVMAKLTYFNAFYYFPVFYITIFSFLLFYRFRLYFNTQNEIKIKEQLARQNEISEQIILALENDRKRLAKDLHDEIGNDLAVLKMQVQSLDMGIPETRHFISTIDKTADDLRHIAHDIMPPEFSQTSFNSLIESYFIQLNKKGNVSFHFITSGINNRFNKQKELMIYRIIMELVNNVLKHSDATSSSLQLIYYDAYLEILFEDNGNGFNPTTEKGFGLKSIGSRVAYLHGKISIDSNIGGSTTIIEIPYHTN